MRWEDLFRDLEAQLEAAEQAELAAEVADRTRAEAARLRMADRLAPAAGHGVRLHVRGAGQVSGRLVSVGSEWLLLDESGRQVLVPLRAVLAAGGLGRLSRDPEAPVGRVAARLGLSSALRGVARDRLPVSVWLLDGAVLTGTLDRVGVDFLEIAEHSSGEPRRSAELTAVRTVPFEAIAAVRTA